MTNTKMLETTYAIIKGLESDQQTMIDSLIKTGADCSKTIGGVEPLLATLVLNLKADIVAEEAKKNGKNNQLKAIKEILKSASKKTNEALHYVKTINGYQYAMDSHILAKINSIGEFKECPENLEYPNVEYFFGQKYTADSELIIPNVAKLKAYIKDQTARHKKERGCRILYNFGKDQPMVQAHMLSIAIDIMVGEYKAYYKGENSALYFEDKNGNEVLLMPVSKKNPSVGFIDETTKL